MPLLVLLSDSTTSQPDYSLLNLVLMAVYVGLTLVLAIVAIASIRISSRQSRDALVASDRQSREAIEAVQKQIEASERQAKEALYNQQKPVIVPLDRLISNDAITYKVSVQNKGAGVALNTYSIATIKGLPHIFCSEQVQFLVPDKEELFSFKVDGGKARFPYNMFEGYTVFSSEVRLITTYNDAFGNKYLAVFDYSSYLGWRQIDEIKRVEQRLDELVIIKH
jgi:hypothetical protein